MISLTTVKTKEPVLVINTTSIAAGGEVHIDIDTGNVKELAITVRVTYDASATSGIRVYVLASPDGTNFDTENTDDAFTYFEPSFQAGATRQKTVNIDALPRYIRLLVRNLDSTYATGEVKVWITVVK